MKLTSLLVALFVLVCGPATASLSVCNTTARAAIVALGRFDGAHWVSDGWWRVKPKQCSPLVSGPLNARYYYMYASDGAFGVWNGPKFFCVGVTDRFSSVERGSCAARGFERRGFFEIDTHNKLNWIQPLTN
jgi:uncharacterized membrane protein